MNFPIFLGINKVQIFFSTRGFILKRGSRTSDDAPLLLLMSVCVR